MPAVSAPQGAPGRDHACCYDRYDVGLANTKDVKRLAAFVTSLRNAACDNVTSTSPGSAAQHSDRWTRAAKLRRVHEGS